MSPASPPDEYQPSFPARFSAQVQSVSARNKSSAAAFALPIRFSRASDSFLPSHEDIASLLSAGTSLSSSSPALVRVAYAETMPLEGAGKGANARLRVEVVHGSGSAARGHTRASVYVLKRVERRLVLLTKEDRLFNSEATCGYSRLAASLRQHNKHHVPAAVTELVNNGRLTLPKPLVLRGSIRVDGRELERWESSNLTRSHDRLVHWSTWSECYKRLNVSSARRACDAFVVLVDAKNGSIARTLWLHTAHARTMKSDWIDERSWAVQATAPRDAMFAFPPSWRLTCLNTDLGIKFDPRVYITVANQSDHLSLQLVGQPVDELGNVLVSFLQPAHRRTPQPDPHGEHMAKQAARVDPAHLVFTSKNWKQPQHVQIKYVRDGQSEFCIHATGGGYDHVNTNDPLAHGCSNRIMVFACRAGEVGRGCSSKLPKVK